MTTYWHGGAPGRSALDWLEPPAVSGARSMASYCPEPEQAAFTAAGYARADLVYVTTRRDDARVFAALWCDDNSLGGSLYEVRPEGELTLDPDCPDGTSWTCARALVVRVAVAHVQIEIGEAMAHLEAPR